MNRNAYCRRIAVIAAGLFPLTAGAASFQILEQSPAQLGKSFAGTASDARDATTVFFNPAAMSQLEGNAVSGGLQLIDTRSQFTDAGSNTGGTAGETDELAVVPNLYGVQHLDDKWVLGVGINAPFGLSSSYEGHWIGRYLATDSDLQVLNVSGKVSYSVTDTLAVALGLNYQRAESTLKNRVDSTLGFAPDPAADSSVTVEGEGDDIVADASMYWKPHRALSFGLSWRQGGDFTLDGDARFDRNVLCTIGAGFPTGAPPAPTTGTLCAASLTTRAGNVESQLDLPDTLTLSGTVWIDEQWAVHADIAQTQWSSIDRIDVVNTNNGVVVDSLDLQYEDTRRFAVGLTYDNGPWTWRFGTAVDEAPQTDSNYTTPRVPDGDRTWLSAGFNYAFNPDISVDVAYARLMVDDVGITDINTTTGNRVVGEFDNEVDIVGLQANWRY